jgi:hypothetical protein
MNQTETGKEPKLSSEIVEKKYIKYFFRFLYSEAADQ